jgi:hypothetical protein
MKNSYILFLCVSLLLTTPYIQSAAEQDFDANLNMLQQSITMLVTQSGLDPAMAQDILDQTNNLSQHAQANIQQDLQEINVAAALSTLLETANQISQTMNMPDVYNILDSFKFPTHANTIHKLLLGAYDGDRTKEPTYTNPYTESIGFIINDWVFAALFQALINAIAPTSFGKALLPNTTPQINNWIAQITAGIASHYAWILQKKLAFQQIQNNAQSLNTQSL